MVVNCFGFQLHGRNSYPPYTNFSRGRCLTYIDTEGNEEKAAHFYSLLIEEFARHDFHKAVTLFNDHYPHHVRSLSPRILVKLGNYYYKEFELDKSKVCLEFAISDSGPWQARALMLLADTYEGLDNVALAGKTWQAVVEQFPKTPFAIEAQKKYEHYSLTPSSSKG